MEGGTLELVRRLCTHTGRSTLLKKAKLTMHVHTFIYIIWVVLRGSVRACIGA